MKRAQGDHWAERDGIKRKKTAQQGSFVTSYKIPRLTVGTAASVKKYITLKNDILTRTSEQKQILDVKNRKKADAQDDLEKGERPNKKFKSSGNTKVDLNAYRSDVIDLGVDGEIKTYFKPSVYCPDIGITCLFSSTRLTKNGKPTSTIKEESYRRMRQYAKGKPVIGCVAWWSDKQTLEHMRKASGVSVLVNREDYDEWGNGCVKNEYPTLPKMPEPMYKMFEHLGGVLSNVERHRKNGRSSLYPIRAFGNGSENKKKRTSFNGQFEGYAGLEHCKYWVFFEKGSIIKEHYSKRGVNLKSLLADYEECYENWSDDKLYPFYVWTGSMNFTGNAKNNHENAIWGKSLIMGLAFFYDFSVTYINSTSVFSKTKASTPTVTTK